MEIKIPVNLVFRKIEDWRNKSDGTIFYGFCGESFNTLISNGQELYISDTDFDYRFGAANPSDFESFWDIDFDKDLLESYVIDFNEEILKFFKEQAG